ncbi:SpoIIIAH-like family protein [Cohnella sp. GCM10027633]|uniref:SpoIIIAH-like family protein n=1 Tax=unclassified Cohnella TaxID=2636738 RepID=UPI00364013C7
MNNKRQTIWLVSMLSLMVILSAYYLFTEDVTPADNASGITDTANDPSGATKANGTNVDGLEITQVDTVTGETDGQQTDDTQAAAEDPSGLSPEDQAVINNLGNLKGSEFLDQIQLQRMEARDKTAVGLQAIIADTKNATPEEAQDASEQLTRLEETDERITALESKLLQDFDNAVVEAKDENTYKVIVLSEKLDKKRAVGIVELATNELKVTPDRVSVQVVEPQ